MTWDTFVERTQAIQANKQTDLCLMLSPKLDQLPLPITRFDEPFFPYGKAIIAATQKLVCGYIFDFAAYLALGAAGVVALERTLGYVDKQSLKILHGPFVGPGYTAMADDIALALDALTLARVEDLITYMEQPPQAAWVVDPTENIRDGGVFLDEEKTVTFYQDSVAVLQLRVISDTLISQDRSDTFADSLRVALDELR